MKISVIIPCLNEAGNISNTLDRLQALRTAGHEIIISDGGSKDNTLALCASRVDHIIHSEAGRAKQMNTAVSQASGDVLWFLHADTLVQPDSHQHILQALNNTAYHWGRFDIILSSPKFIFRIIERMMNFRSCLTAIATGDQGIFIRKSGLENIGGYKDISLMEDIEISKRLRHLSKPACIKQPLTTSSRRWEKHGVIRTIVLMWYLRLRFFLGTPADSLSVLYRNHD
ncbi:MAG: TIGR04283 family arsenosugar biosynthesis glycosyltransferase [Gammaproteobacteria bacterium]|nr:TIGR04283 family arsenosugar biosynthesis glycosyltransferase [Gammaproteobacteria bacterium]